MAQLIGSSLVQAFSFVGAQWLFSQFNHKDYEEEIKRHSKAIEEQTKKRNEFFEEQTKRKNRIEELEKMQQTVKKDFARINKEFEELSRLKK